MSTIMGGNLSLPCRITRPHICSSNGALLMGVPSITQLRALTDTPSLNIDCVPQSIDAPESAASIASSICIFQQYH